MYVIRRFGLRLHRFSKNIIRSLSVERSVAPKPMISDFSLSQYDVIGFDLDHTLCKYKLTPLFNLIYTSLATFFCAKYHYPKSLLEKQPHEHGFIQKGIVLDKARGNFLKLDENHRIVKAFHGTRLMTEEEVHDIYGNAKIWEESLGIPDKLCSEGPLDQPFYVFKDYFVTVGALVCAKVVDVLDEQNRGPLPSYSFWKHFLEGLFYMYERSNFKTGAGNVFPTLRKNPDAYLEHCTPQMKEWLKEMHRTKKTFLITSANFDSASFIAEYCIGEDWQNYFDVIVTFARKPGFFTKMSPFYKVENDSEISEISVDQMKPHTIYSQGNWRQLWNFFNNNSKVDKPKALYVGDSIVEDIYASSSRGGCDTIAIVEEMFTEGVVESPRCDEVKLLQSDCWGSFFTAENGNQQNLSLWASILQRHSKLIVPSIDTLATLSVSSKVHSFSVDYPFGGYFPNIPSSLNR